MGYLESEFLILIFENCFIMRLILLNFPKHFQIVKSCQFLLD